MATFKGGFAFNNKAAKVEVEQAPDGTLISCVNPVTGESLGGNWVEEIEGTADTLFGDDGLTGFSSLDDFKRQIIDNNISLSITFDLTDLGFGPLTVPVIYNPDNNVIFATTLRVSNNEIAGVNVSQFGYSYSIGANLISMGCSSLYAVTNSVITDGSAYLASIPTTTKIYHHPMPV